MQKETGSYYTPDYLTNFILKRVFSISKSRRKLLLEPSVGDGKFIKSIVDNNLKSKVSKIIAIDINEKEVKKAEKIWGSKKGIFQKDNFLSFETKEKFHAVIGNPPYIRGTLLTKTAHERCKEIHKSVNLSNNSIKNIWTSFIIKSTRLLKSNGILAFVLPSELLQVKFAEEIRKFLQREFQRIEIFTFNDLMFECKGQHTLVLFAIKKSKNKGVFFANIEDKSQLIHEDFKLKENKMLVDSKVKWTHHEISSEDLSFLNKLKSQTKSINDYCDSMPGIVTAANSYFIVDEETEKKYRLKKYTVPIIQKGLFVNGSVVFDKDDYDKLVESKFPSRFIKFSKNDDSKFSKSVLKYLELGEEMKIHERFKCRKREKWFVVPNVSTQPEAFFLKRSHLYPKVIKNLANAFVTDSAYKIMMKDNFNVDGFVYSFYNSLTLAFAELEGRYYGGGVLELVPSEFKKLPLPYNSINSSEFKSFRASFEQKDNIESILKTNDAKILKSVFKLSKSDILRIEKIRKKLVDKRLRRN